MLSAAKKEFIEFMMSADVLRFGDFVTKSGRNTPYFVNTGNYKTGLQSSKLGEFYAAFIKETIGDCFDAMFGPAYKGIPLETTTAGALARNYQIDKPYFFNRKEVKDHGEGGNTVGAPIKGHVVIIDDVISAGTSVGESVKIIEACGAHPSGVLLALDRMECAGTAEKVADRSAVEDVKARYAMPVVAIADLSDLMSFLKETKDPELSAYQEAISEYRRKYGSK